MKKFTIGFLAVLLAFATAPAVFGSGTSDSGSGAASKTLTFLTWMDITVDNVRSTVYKEVIDEFEKTYPEFKLEWRTLPWREVITQISVMHEAGVTADFVGMGQVGMRAQIDAGRVKDLTPYYDKYPHLKEDLESANLRAAIVDGKYYGIPHVTDGTANFWRKDLFREAGLDPEKPPMVWDELISMGKKLTSGDQWGVGMTMTSNWNPQHFTQYVAMHGGHFLDSSGRADTNNAGTRSALQDWVDLVQKHKVTPPEVVGMNPSATRDAQIQGKLAITINLGNWDHRDLIEALGEENIGKEFHPVPRAGIETLSHCSGWSFMIFEKAKHPEAAFDFVQIANKPEYLERLVLADYGLPVNVNGIEAIKDKDPDVYKWAMHARKGIPVPPTPHVVNLWAIMSKNMQKAVLAELTVEEALKATDEEFNKTNF